MGCGRRGTGSDEERALRKIAEAHERLGLSGVFEHIENAVSAADESVRHLNHADRAAALDEPAEVVELYRADAGRMNRIARRQVGAALSELRDVRRQDDWASLAEQARMGFQERNGQELYDDTRAGLRRKLVEIGSDAETAVWIAGMVDEVFVTTGEDLLDRPADFLEEWLTRGETGLADPEMGRQNASPRSVLLGICLAAALVGLAVALACCIIFGACLWAMAVMVAFNLHLGACFALDELLAALGWEN